MDYSLTHIRLLVRDYSACFSFYKETLGLHVAWGNQSTGYAEFDTGAIRLAVFGRQEMAQVVGRQSLPSKVRCQDHATVIFRVEDVDQAFKELKSKGVDFVTDPVDRPEWGIRTAHLRDPEGNLVEINKRIES